MATFCILLTLALQEFAKDEYKHKLKFGSCSACFRHETFRIRTCCICQYLKRGRQQGPKGKEKQQYISYSISSYWANWVIISNHGDPKFYHGFSGL